MQERARRLGAPGSHAIDDEHQRETITPNPAVDESLFSIRSRVTRLAIASEQREVQRRADICQGQDDERHEQDKQDVPRQQTGNHGRNREHRDASYAGETQPSPAR
jgi:hypothetical protein